MGETQRREVAPGYGEFKENVADRLDKLEAERSKWATKEELKTHWATKEELNKAKNWALGGVVVGLLMLAGALYKTNADITTELMNVITMLAETLKP